MKELVTFMLFVTASVFVNDVSSAEFSNQHKAEIVMQMANMIERRYVYKEIGQQLAERMRADLQAGHFDTISDKQAFADFFTDYLRQESQDGHLALDYKPAEPASSPNRDVEAQEAYEASEMERWYGAHINHGFFGLNRLANNIGVLDLRVFAPPDMAAELVHASMTLSAQFDALIIDLRKNGGGMGELGHMMLAYLFDKPCQPLSGIYHRPSDVHTNYATSDKLPVRRFGGQKPLYILTSKRTFSAAEAFAYDLQALERATIVGEVTGGGAHPFEYRSIDDEFFLSLAEARSIHPITKTNWQYVGVQPDVEVKASDAFDTAIELAMKRLSSSD